MDNINLIYVDLFCGAGGTSTGISLARIGNSSCAMVAACINHDSKAIRSHKSNHKNTLHFTEDITMLYKRARFGRLISHLQMLRTMYPEVKVVLWASLECTNFSKAKGGLPRDADSRTLANHLFPYIQALDPDYIQIENVEEFQSWGDLDANGKPVSKDKGVKYLQWIDRVQYGYGKHSDRVEPENYNGWFTWCRQNNSLDKVYNFEHRILNAADFGAYTSRKRYFGIFAKQGLPIVWPEQTHASRKQLAKMQAGKGKQMSLFTESVNLKPWNAVKEVLDFSDEGESIFDRAKPLVEATLARVYAGLIKEVAGGKENWLLKYNSVNGKTKSHVPPSVDDPCPVISTQSRLGLMQCSFLSKQYSGEPYSKVVSLNDPAGTITTIDHHAFISAYYGNGHNITSVHQPSPTVTTKDRLSLVQSFFMNQYSGGGQSSSIDKPCPAVTTTPKQNLVTTSFIDQQFGQNKPVGVKQPLGCLTANPKYSLVTCHPWIMNTNFGNVGSNVNDPAPVITANRKWHYLMNPQYASAGSSVNDPCFTLIARMDKRPPYVVECSREGNTPSFIRNTPEVLVYEIYSTDSEMTVKIKEFMALYGIVDIKMRMLRIPELKKIMGFPEYYILVGSQADQKKFIGNAVEVNMARVLCEALSRSILELKINAA